MYQTHPQKPHAGSLITERDRMAHEIASLVNYLTSRPFVFPARHIS